VFVYDHIDDLAEFKFNLLIDFLLPLISQNLWNKF